MAEHSASKASFGRRGSCSTHKIATNKKAKNATPSQSGKLKAPAIATPSKVPCAMVSAKKDMRRHNIKQPSGAVRNTNKVPIVHAGNKSCNHSIMA